MNNYFTNTKGSLALAEEKLLMDNGYNAVTLAVEEVQHDVIPQYKQEVQHVERTEMSRKQLDRCYQEAIELSSYKNYKEKKEAEVNVCEGVTESIGKRIWSASKKWVVDFINE